METEEEVIEIESLENSNNQFPIYKTKTGRKFIGLFKILNDNSVHGFGIPDDSNINCSEDLLEETGEFGDMPPISILKKNTPSYKIIRENGYLEETCRYPQGF